MTPPTDLTRWNRAGLARFRYVDGNAAVWLEELRIGMLAQYLRGIVRGERLPEKWRDLFLEKMSDWELTLPQAEFAEAVAWARLLPPPPASPETGGTRNRRLAEQYGRRSSDYAWELTQAFARAAHILLEHLDAYANEGYLATATQWDNLRKLVAAVNYLPTPPASATTTVGLHIAEGVGAIEVAAGLAAKYSRPEGGAPLIFETLKPVVGHSDLNAARAVGWDRDERRIDISAPTAWIVPEKARLAPGDLAVLAGAGDGATLSVATVELDKGRALATFTLEAAADAPRSFEAGLHIEPDGVRLGLPESTSKQLVLDVAGAASIPAHSVVEIRYADNKTAQAIVAESRGGQLILSGLEAGIRGAVQVEPYTPIGTDGAGYFETVAEVQALFFKTVGGAVVAQGDSDQRPAEENSATIVARTFARPSGTTGIAYAKLGANRTFNGTVVATAPPSIGSAGSMVRFEGKLPKALKPGDWYVARPLGSAAPRALKVVGVRVEAEFHYVMFHKPLPDAPERTEFLGPMTRRLQPQDHDRSPDPAIVGGVAILRGISASARALVKPGRAALVVLEEGKARKAGQATIGEVETAGDDLRLILVSETDFGDWRKGWTTFHLNTVGMSHGETKAPKVLGSGDAEKTRQDLPFKVDTVSFVPSSASASGVAPDMDVAVDGVKWEYRDLGDHLAEGADAWSVRLNEDNSLQIQFRRRLPTGRNNLTVPRHRVGVGLSGTGIPPWSFTAPVKKNRFVTAITQPIATAGGADREPVSAMRENAPSNLAANGRAVSLRDFERLCTRHSSVWQAHARQVLGVASANLVDIVIVPSGGGAVTAALKDNLAGFIRSRALPGVAVTISAYEAVLVKFAVTVRVDVERFDKADVQEAVLAALTDSFSLRRRKLGQPLYVAEILAAAERVDGVETVVIGAFARKPGSPAPLREAQMSGALAAVFPRVDQVVHVAGSADVAAVMAAVR
jgi:hypothetical protein